MQLTPTAIYGFTVKEVVAKVIVLGQYGMSTGGPVQYQTHREHWFTNASLSSLKDELSAGQSMSWTKIYQSETEDPDENFIELSKDIDSSWGTFYIYSKSVLTQNDWQAGPLPSLGNVNPFLFVNEQGQQEKDRPRVAFCVDGSDPKVLAKVVWLTKDNGVSSYTPMSLSAEDISKYDGSEYYHYIASK